MSVLSVTTVLVSIRQLHECVGVLGVVDRSLSFSYTHNKAQCWFFSGTKYLEIVFRVYVFMLFALFEFGFASITKLEDIVSVL